MMSIITLFLKLRKKIFRQPFNSLHHVCSQNLLDVMMLVDFIFLMSRVSKGHIKLRIQHGTEPN